MRNIYTDLAMESGRIAEGGEIKGVMVERDSVHGAECVRVRVLDEDGAAEVGKPVGTYSTIICPALVRREPGARADSAALLRRELSALLAAEKTIDDVTNTRSTTLVIGLGNRRVTPDSLGPRVIGQVLATRHLFGQLPEELTGHMSSVCAIDPGVLGSTGIETAELARGLAERIRPARIIAIDALAARRTERIASTIQLSDSGIHPGSGVGNHRGALSRNELGIPVYAIGVPMVVYASTIIADALEKLGDTSIGADSIRDSIGETLAEMIVAPREIDDMISESAAVIADALNHALHPRLGDDELQWLLS